MTKFERRLLRFMFKHLGPVVVKKYGKTGKAYYAYSPFAVHEKTPSFVFNPSLHKAHCFATGMELNTRFYHSLFSRMLAHQRNGDYSRRKERHRNWEVEKTNQEPIKF